jgi:UPF0042 nucleotide-binding protein
LTLQGDFLSENDKFFDILIMKLLIISGRSGSGKSICLRLLEDQGFYCVDNLPLDLLPHLCQQIKEQHPRVAVSVDARSSSTSDLKQFSAILAEVNALGYSPNVIYLDASSDILLKRYSETRRKHPLSNMTTPLKEAIEIERQLLAPIANVADMIIDTSHLSSQQLGNVFRERGIGQQNSNLSILLESFGYKHGIPADADYIFDIRCLPNPYWEPALRDLTGLDATVIDYLSNQPLVQEMQKDITGFLDKWIPKFINDKRCYLTICIGCTGGRHRSVYLVDRLAHYYRQHYSGILVRHRDMVGS